MAEMLLMESLKLFIAYICYFGTGVLALDQLTEGAIKEAIRVSPIAQNIIMWLLIAFWVIKIIWFIIDKRLVYKERNLEMDKTREEIQDLKEDH